MRVCGFWTNEKYKLLFMKMAGSVGRWWKMGVEGYEREDRGWAWAMRQKVEVIKSCLTQYPGEGVLYLDADCEVKDLKQESYDWMDADVAFPLWKGRPMGCVLWFKGGKRSLDVLEEWARGWELNPGIELDETHLWDAVGRLEGKVIWKEMGKEWGSWPGTTRAPVVVHTGAGRGEEKRRILGEEGSPYKGTDWAPVFVTLAWGKAYEECIPALERGAKEHGIHLEVYRKSGIGPSSPMEAWARKPALMLDVMDRFHRGVVWVDADAEFLERPSDLMEMYAGDLYLAKPEGSARYWGGTIGAQDTPEARETLILWMRLMLSRDWPLDEDALLEAVKIVKPHVTLLGPEYVWVEDWLRVLYPDAKPVISHLAIGAKSKKQ